MLCPSDKVGNTHTHIHYCDITNQGVYIQPSTSCLHLENPDKAQVQAHIRKFKTHLHISEAPLPPHPPPRVQPHQSDLSSATQDKEKGFLVALEGPIGGSLAFNLFPALGQDPVEQVWRSLCRGLRGHGLRQRDLGAPNQERAFTLTLALLQPHSSSTSSAPPLECLQNVSTGGQRGNNKHKDPVYSL